MGNVQCCASGRFQEGKPQKPKEKKKKKIKGLKGVSKKPNGIGSVKGNGGVTKITVAEDGSERAPPVQPQNEKLAQAAPPAADDAPDQTAAENKSSTEPDGSPRNESIAVARERFFGQVGSNFIKNKPEISRKLL